MRIPERGLPRGEVFSTEGMAKALPVALRERQLVEYLNELLRRASGS